MLTLHILGIWRERRERKVWRPWSFLDYLGKPSISTVLAIPYSALLSVSTAISRLRCWLSPTPPNSLLYTRCWNMCLLCIPCKFTLFQAEFKWRLGNCMMTIKYCVGCRKITGRQRWAYLDLQVSQKYVSTSSWRNSISHGIGRPCFLLLQGMSMWGCLAIIPRYDHVGFVSQKNFFSSGNEDKTVREAWWLNYLFAGRTIVNIHIQALLGDHFTE